MKRIFILCLLALMLVSCSKKDIADDKKCSELGSGLTQTLADNQEYHKFDDAHISASFPNKDSYNDRYVIYSADTNDINEIGVFHADSDEHARELLDDCKKYVEDMQNNSRAFIASYAPDELPKLDAARVERVGNYIIYTVLPDDKADEVIERLRADLKK